MIQIAQTYRTQLPAGHPSPVERIALSARALPIVRISRAG
ncbi:hypothetical protein HNQ88_002806 [Aureibacter tunicatorum]|uniref:Uncharacterized protein n=1 Tax=Aureibacter tunicatorum TaxID=866807 RepID=A0AAE4BTE6_9BACT|nr:hypothetical protein [Aureibacter tunicatorum]